MSHKVLRYISQQLGGKRFSDAILLRFVVLMAFKDIAAQYE